MALVKHWLHLFRRLVPAAVTVLVAVLAATILFLPRTRWLEVISQGWASLFYAENWLLQSQATNYYAADHSQASPFQHFWSLSIQGQVFILWPLIFAGAAIVAKRFRLRYRVLLCYIFAADLRCFAGLLDRLHPGEPDGGVLRHRAGCGSLRWARSWLWPFPPCGFRGAGGSGLAGWALWPCSAAASCSTSRLPSPGIVALWPTLAAACVIAAGQSGSKLGVDRILSSKPLVRLGDISYALYLWHWPVLVIALAVTHRDKCGSDHRRRHRHCFAGARLPHHPLHREALA